MLLRRNDPSAGGAKSSRTCRFRHGETSHASAPAVSQHRLWSLRVLHSVLLGGLLVIGNACMGWPGLTALLVQQREDSHDLPGVALLAGLAGMSVPLCRYSAECWIFTAPAWTPNVGGLASADASCQSAAGGLALAGTYRAILITEDATRDTTNGWVMYPGMAYRTASGGNFIVGTTNALGVFTFPMTTAIGTIQTWTGGDSIWAASPGNTCTNWTSTSGTGTTGLASATSSNMIYSGATNGCSGSMGLYCVQQ